MTAFRPEHHEKTHGDAQRDPQDICPKHNLEQECPTKKFQTQKVCCWLEKLALAELDRMEMDFLLRQWTLLDEQLAAIEVKIAVRAAADEQAKLLQSMPGLGEYSAVAIASRIGDIHRFKRPSSLANYFGLTPACRNSGEATQRLGSITKQGSKIVRYLLGQAVIESVAVRQCDVIGGHNT